VAHAAPLTGTGPGQIRGREGLNGSISGIHAILPDLALVIEVGPITDEEHMVVRRKARGTYRGGFPGSAPEAVGREVIFTGTDTLRSGWAPRPAPLTARTPRSSRSRPPRPRSSAKRCGDLGGRDVVLALPGERAAVPVLVALPQRQAGQPDHQVQLTRPAVRSRSGPQRGARASNVPRWQVTARATGSPVRNSISTESSVSARVATEPMVPRSPGPCRATPAALFCRLGDGPGRLPRPADGPDGLCAEGLS
jgi:hypothetical protein